MYCYKLEWDQSIMPEIQVIFFQETDGAVPILEWLDSLVPKARAKCIVKVERLGALGHEFRRPEADYLRDDIYELRTGYQGINYRILYFFHERTAAIVSHGLVKEQQVPPHEIDLAIKRKQLFEQHPKQHTFTLEYHHE